MLGRFLKHTRRQPKHVRDRYALCFASGIMSIVVLLWIFIPGSVSDGQDISNEDEFKPFATFRNVVGGQIAAVRESISSSTKSVNETIEEANEESQASNSETRATTSIKLTAEDIAEINKERAEAEEYNYDDGANGSEVSNVERETVLIATTSSQTATSSTDTNEE